MKSDEERDLMERFMRYEISAEYYLEELRLLGLKKHKTKYRPCFWANLPLPLVYIIWYLIGFCVSWPILYVLVSWALS